MISTTNPETTQALRKLQSQIGGSKPTVPTPTGKQEVKFSAVQSNIDPCTCSETIVENAQEFE